MEGADIVSTQLRRSDKLTAWIKRAEMDVWTRRIPTFSGPWNFKLTDDALRVELENCPLFEWSQ